MSSLTRPTEKISVRNLQRGEEVVSRDDFYNDPVTQMFLLRELKDLRDAVFTFPGYDASCRD